MNYVQYAALERTVHFFDYLFPCNRSSDEQIHRSIFVK